jgi:hypothetical protein
MERRFFGKHVLISGGLGFICLVIALRVAGGGYDQRSGCSLKFKHTGMNKKHYD